MNEPLVIIAGPTAVGKTALSIALAKKLNGEIISGRPEYEDLLKIANKTDIPLIEVKKIVGNYDD